MESKPMIASWTVWLNVLLPVLALLVPGVKDLLTPELEASIILVVNLVLRIFKTSKPIKGVLK